MNPKYFALIEQFFIEIGKNLASRKIN